MRRKVATLSAMLVMSAFAAGASLADSITYKNARFGTQISFPAALFNKTAELPTNGDGALFTHPDGGSLAVYSFNNALDLNAKEMAANMRSRIGEDFSITYERVENDWLVQSGYEDGLIYYQRVEFGADNVIHGFLMKWPESLRSKYDARVAEIGKSFGGP